MTTSIKASKKISKKVSGTKKSIEKVAVEPTTPAKTKEQAFNDAVEAGCRILLRREEERQRLNQMQQVESEGDRNNRLQREQERRNVSTVVAETVIQNKQGIDVNRIERASGKASNMIHGHSHTKFFMWAGAKGWTIAEIQSTLKALNIPEVSLNSIRTFYYAGKAGEAKAFHGRGELPKYTKEQVEQLNTAAGRVAQATKKPAKKSK